LLCSRDAECTIAIARPDCDLPARRRISQATGRAGRSRRKHRIKVRESIPVIISDDLRKQFGPPDDSPLFDAMPT